MASTFPKLPIFEALASHDPDATAIIHSTSDRAFTYGQLLSDVEGAKIQLYHRLKNAARNGEPIGGQRVAFLIENGYDYVVTLLSIFACDGIAVPLSTSYPASELRYIVQNSDPLTLLASEMFKGEAEKILEGSSEKKPTLNLIEKILTGGEHDEVQLIELPVTKGGMMLYTSGTTSRPKGAVLNTSALTAQSLSLQKAWEYSSSDHILHVLPLHHIHGTLNCLLTPLFAGSTIEFLAPFNPSAVWSRLASPFKTQLPSDTRKKEPISFFSAVPTIWTRLLSTFATLPPETQAAARTAISPTNLRLNISGSAALPSPIQQQWRSLSSENTLLERFGMTEVGMALSCGLHPSSRLDGSVGWPLPDVEVRLIETDTGTTICEGEEHDTNGKEREGEIHIRGPTVFSEYWRNPAATASEFVDLGDEGGKWFRTGDVAVRRTVSNVESHQDWVKGPAYFIRGRKSTDIIKTGGEKVSALEVERELLSLPQIAEAAVVGLPSEQWGQKVCAVVVLASGQEYTGRGGEDGKRWGVMDLRRALKAQLAGYKIPQELRVVGEVKRNAMGKVNKKELVEHLLSET